MLRMVMMAKRGDGSFEHPRRQCLDLLTPPELKLREALDAVEELPADPRLTAISVGIAGLLDKFADWAEAAGYVKPD